MRNIELNAKTLLYNMYSTKCTKAIYTLLKMLNVRTVKLNII